MHRSRRPSGIYDRTFRGKMPLSSSDFLSLVIADAPALWMSLCIPVSIGLGLSTLWAGGVVCGASRNHVSILRGCRFLLRPSFATASGDYAGQAASDHGTQLTRPDTVCRPCLPALRA